MRALAFAVMAVTVAMGSGCASMATAPITTSPRAAAPIERIGRMAVAVDRALAMAGRHGPEHVLVVFDLDSTLLRDPRRSPDLEELGETDPMRFRQVERTIMYLKSLVPTETALAGQLERLRAAGIPAYLLTARGTDMRDMTVREMQATGIVLPPAPECGPPLCPGRGTISPDQMHAAARAALGDAELARLGFARGRATTVWDGIVMAAGQDKGVIMRTLGASLGRPIRGYVLIDDAQKNVESVVRASSGMREEVAVFHYRSPEPGTDRRTQAQTEEQWDAAQRAICIAFAPRWCR